MSLIVYPYNRDHKTGEMVGIDEQPDKPFNNLFGFEIWRLTVWGSINLKNFHCELLNSLSCQDIYAEKQKIQQLKNELELVKDNIVDLVDELNVDIQSLEFRLGNALEAIRIAEKQVNGGVYIG